MAPIEPDTEPDLPDVVAVIHAYKDVIRAHFGEAEAVRKAHELQAVLRTESGDAAAIRREALDRVALDQGLDLKDLAVVAGGVTVQRAWQLRKQARERADRGSA